MDFPKMCPARWLSDQNFGMCITPHDFFYPLYDMHSNYFRPWRLYNQSISKEFGSTVENDKGNYKITLDVQHFHPNEINVKVKDNQIIVEGKHEERPDTHGYITRQFTRRYPLPNQCPPENVTSTLSSDGILTIIAEKKALKETEKIVPIKMCGTSPRKTLVETKITTNTSQQSQKENVKSTEDTMSKNKTEIMLKEDHSRLLKPEFLKEAVAESNGTNSSKATLKESIDIVTKTSNPLDSTSNKIEKTIERTIMGLTALTEQLGQSSGASTSEAASKKVASETSGVKSTAETCGMTSSSAACEMKGTSESNMKGMSKTLIEESSSYKSSSSSMSASTRISGKATECVSDIISAELREAAENV